MMDVDDSLRITLDELARQNAHVPGENDEIGLVALEELDVTPLDD